MGFGGSWTEQKLICISKYLAGYTTALKNKPFNLIYIDAFAGSGYRELNLEGSADSPLLPDLAGDEPVRFLDGSVRRSLQVEPPFDRYIFIEKNATKYRKLQKMRSEFPTRVIEPYHAEANAFLPKLLTSVDWSKSRAVLFLDPFGMEVEWATIRAVAATGAIDVWYLFPLEVYRLLRKDGMISETWRGRLDSIFGTSDWYGQFYRTRPRQTLFEPEESLERSVSVSAMQDYVQKRLASVFPAVAQNPLVLYNSGNTPLFLLCFAVSTKSGKGQKLALGIAENVLGKGRRLG